METSFSSWQSSCPAMFETSGIFCVYNCKLASFFREFCRNVNGCRARTFGVLPDRWFFACGMRWIVFFCPRDTKSFALNLPYLKKIRNFCISTCKRCQYFSSGGRSLVVFVCLRTVCLFCCDSRTAWRSHAPPVTSTASSGLTLLLTVCPGVTQSTKLLPSSKRTEENHSKTRDRGGRPLPPPPPHQTSHFPADTARGPVCPASVWSATTVPAVDDNVEETS